MSEKNLRGVSTLERVSKAEFDEIAVAKLLDRQIGVGSSGPVGRPEYGFSNALFRFTHDGETHFVRLRPREKIETQVHLHALLKEIEIPDPEIVTAGFDDEIGTGFVIQKAVEGTELLNYENDKEKQLELLKMAMPMLHKIHTIELPKFGKLTTSESSLEGDSNSWTEYIQSIKPNIKYLLENELITRDDELYFDSVFTNLLEQEVEQGVLLHNDFHRAHIFTNGTEITGIIDWDRALVGDPAYDLAVTITGLDGESSKSIEEAYGKEVDTEVVGQYRFLILLGKIMWRHKNSINTLELGLRELQMLRETRFKI